MTWMTRSSTSSVAIPDPIMTIQKEEPAMLMVSKVESKMLESIPERWQSVMHRIWRKSTMSSGQLTFGCYTTRLMSRSSISAPLFWKETVCATRSTSTISRLPSAVLPSCGTTSATSAKSAGRRVYRRRMYGVPSSSGSPKRRTSSTAGSRCLPD